jgi:hypothetical protein
MAHFAQVIDGIVQQVLVIEQDVINTGLFGDPSQWIQTSYNTVGGTHTQGGTPLRKNFAGVGFIYDSELDAFYPPQPFTSWTLDPETCYWMPPVAMPDDGKEYMWNELKLKWVEM